MKKYLHLFGCIVISLTFLAGCGNYAKSISSAGKENALMKITPSQSVDTFGLKPTQYETVNNFDGVNMAVKKDTVSPTGLTIAFKNNSRRQCIYGEYFCMEKKINGKWYQVPAAIKGNYAFDAIGYNLAAGSDSEWKVSWDWLYGSLDTGEYRLVKDIGDFRGTGDYDTYYLAAEFAIN